MRNLYHVPVCLLLAVVPASAGIIQTLQPNATYVTNTGLASIVGAQGTTVGSVTNGVITVNFSVIQEIANMGSGWGSWGTPPDTESSNPRVLFDSLGGSTLTMTFSDPVITFGLEAEPDFFGFFDITMKFYNGVTLLGSLTRSIDGDGGARLLAGTTDGAPITSAVLTGTNSSFAIGNIRTSVPEPASFALFGAGLVAVSVAGRRRRRS